MLQEDEAKAIPIGLPVKQNKKIGYLTLLFTHCKNYPMMRGFYLALEVLQVCDIPGCTGKPTHEPERHQQQSLPVCVYILLKMYSVGITSGFQCEVAGR